MTLSLARAPCSCLPIIRARALGANEFVVWSHALIVMVCFSGSFVNRSFPYLPCFVCAGGSDCTVMITLALSVFIPFLFTDIDVCRMLLSLSQVIFSSRSSRLAREFLDSTGITIVFAVCHQRIESLFCCVLQAAHFARGQINGGANS